MPSADGEGSLSPERWAVIFGGEGMGLGLSLNMDQWKKSFQPPRIYLFQGALDALEELKTWVSADDALLVADENTYQAAGEKVKSILAKQRIKVETVLSPQLHASADDQTLEFLAKAYTGPADAVIGVGAGSITDLGKLLSVSRNVPFISVPTAPSMDGYSSSVASILEKGIKVTKPAVSPVAIVADVEVIAAAPKELIRAGVGEALSKFTALADWLLGHYVRGEALDRSLLEQEAALCNDLFRNIGQNAPSELVEALMKVHLFAGMASAIAGQSRPTSGSEHLISHFWEMKYDLSVKAIYHGLQVGMAARLVGAMYKRLSHVSLYANPRIADVEGTEDSLARVFGATQAKLIPKHRATPEEQQAEKELLDSVWSTWLEETEKLLDMRDLAERAIPDDYKLPPFQAFGLDFDQVLESIVYARYIRDRYTVLDAFANKGILDELAETALMDCWGSA
jgi:glycerol-1-phosphate dehydrogenase [NAD(P)+]